MPLELSRKEEKQNDSPASQRNAAVTKQERPSVFAPMCAREPERRGCFLHPEDRATLVNDFQGRVGKASDNVSTAITIVGFEKLIEKEEEIPWLVGLVLDAVSFGVGMALTKVAKRGVAAAVEKLHDLGAVGRLTNTPSFAGWAEGKVRTIDDSTIKSLVTSLVTKGKDGLVSVETGSGGRNVDKRRESVSYLEALRDESDEAFQRVSELTPRRTTDAELLELFAAFDVKAHTVGRYVQMFRDKLKRFHSSGVTAIGRRDMARDSGYAIAKQGLFKYATDAVVRDTRVVWHTFVSGYPPQLMYQFHDGEPVLDLDELQRVAANKRLATFGPKVPRTVKPELGGAVPGEFVGVALERHHAMWGTEPATVLIDDSHSFDPMRVAAAVRNKAKQSSVETGSAR